MLRPISKHKRHSNESSTRRKRMAPSLWDKLNSVGVVFLASGLPSFLPLSFPNYSSRCIVDLLYLHLIMLHCTRTFFGTDECDLRLSILHDYSGHSFLCKTALLHIGLLLYYCGQLTDSVRAKTRIAYKFH